MWLLALFVGVVDTTSLAVPVAPAETLHAVIAGVGDPVVLVPGMLGSAFGFRKVEPLLLAAGYRTIVIEPLGIGGSSRPARADYSLTAQADRIAAVLDSLRLSPVIMVAHSVGASMAYRLAYRRPDLVRGIVSLDGGPAEAAATPGFRRAMAFAPWIKWLGGVRLVRSRLRRSLLAASGDSSWVSDVVVNGYTADAAANLDGTLRAYLGMARARERERLVPHLGEIRCRVLLLVGSARHDGGISAKEIGLLQGGLAALVIDTVPAAGLFLQEERPDAVALAVRAIAGHSDAAAWRGADRRRYVLPSSTPTTDSPARAGTSAARPRCITASITPATSRPDSASTP